MPQSAPAQVPSIQYPGNIISAPYASYLEIERLEYKSGLAKAKGATETLLTSNLAGALGTIGQLTATIYNQPGNNQPNTQLGNAITAIQNQKRVLTYGGTGTKAKGIRTQIEAGNIDDIPDRLFEGVTLSDGTPVTKAFLKSQLQKAKNSSNSKNQKLNIALPNEMQFGYGASWNNTFKIGTLAQAFASSGGLAKTGAAAVVGAGVGAFLAKIKQGAAANPNAALLSGAATGAAAALDPFKINSSLNPTDPKGLANLAGLAGMAPNENAVQFFSNIEFREFDFTFEIFASGLNESKKAEQIVQFFKEGMHPSAPAGTGVLKFPDVYLITPMFVPVGPDGFAKKPQPHRLLPKSKSCAVTNVRVNVTPMNSVQTTYDGVFPLVTINVTFKELTALVREDLANGY